VTVEAACSKHRREDVLPLHPELAAQLRSWIEGLAPDELFFRLLDNRRTWLMVKKDLERVGIPYETPEGTPISMPPDVTPTSPSSFGMA
jgi:hypothetical protein